MLATLSTARAGDCGAVVDLVDDAEKALLLMDVDNARSTLEVAEVAMDCDWVTDRDMLARFWLIEGALLSFGGDVAGAADSFRAAHRVAPTLWLVDLGPALLNAYEAAAAEAPGTGRIEVKDLPPGYRVRVDGVPLEGAEVEAGIHLVQIGAVDVRFARIVYVLPNGTSTLEPDLPPLAAAPIAASGPPLPTVAPSSPLRMYVAAGVAGAAGDALSVRTSDGARAEEPGAKIRVPVEVGLAVRRDVAWGRATLGAGPLLSGPLLYRGDEGVRATRLAVQPAVAGGARVGPVDLGAQLGLLLPSRFAAGLVAAVEVVEDWAVEARLGADLHPARAAEPAAALLATWRPEVP